jgi:predicted ABC-type ATPase
MPPSEPAERPTLWIIAGANGSGKSTAYERASVDAPTGSVWFINPDALAKRIADHEHLPLTPDANLESVRRIERWLHASVDAHQTVGVETVLATAKYQRLVERAHEQGFRVRLIYVFLKSADLNIARVRDRVAKGGHDVPEESVRTRRVRSFGQLSWFFDQADEAEIFDNSGAAPRRVVSKADGDIVVFSRLIPELLAALAPAAPGLAELLQAQPPPRRRRRRRRRRRKPPLETKISMVSG